MGGGGGAEEILPALPPPLFSPPGGVRGERGGPTQPFATLFHVVYTYNERNNDIIIYIFFIEDELRRYEERLVKDENIFKKVLEHEVEATKIMRDFQNYANFTYKYKTTISAVSGASDADAQYFSHRLWRAKKSGTTK